MYKNLCPCGPYVLGRRDRLSTGYIIVFEVEINTKKTNKAEKRERKYWGVFGLVCWFWVRIYRK